MCITAIANMRQNSLKEGKPKTIFSKEKEIIPFIEQYWESMTTMPRRVTQSWYTTVQRSLLKDVQITFTYEDHPEQGAMFGLVATDLTQIKPSYETMGKLGALRLTEDGYAQGELKCYRFSSNWSFPLIRKNQLSLIKIGPTKWGVK